jgi:hypothetical protein
MDIGLESRREGSGVRVPMGCSGRTAQPDLVTIGTIDMGRDWERRAAAVRIILREGDRETTVNQGQSFNIG